MRSSIALMPNGKPSSRKRFTVDAIAPAPKSRSFIVGSTGSGKSTLAAALLASYRRRHPHHFLYVVDPKRRFVAVEHHDTDRRLFPEGFRESNFGRRDGVAIVAEEVSKPKREHDPEAWERTFLVQDEQATFDIFRWLYDHNDVRYPTLLYLDESFDIVQGNRAHPDFRRLLQQGRELGIGAAIVNQRPAWIDRTMLTEADALYIGSLNHPDDRKTISTVVADQSAAPKLLGFMPRFNWLYADQHKPSHFQFTLTGVGNA